MPYLGKSPSQGVRSRYQFTPNAGTTSISGADANGDTLTFTDGNYVDVYLNGVMLKAGVDYVTTTANTIGSLAATVASDVVDVIVYDTFSLFGGTLEGNVKVNNGTLNVTGAVDFDSTLNVDGASTFTGDVTINHGSGATTGVLNIGNSNGNGTLAQINMGHSGDPDHGNISYTGSMVFKTGANATALTLDGSQNATFAGEITLSNAAPKITLTDTSGNTDSLIFSDGGTGHGSLFLSADHNNEAANSKLVMRVDGGDELTLTDGNATFAGGITAAHHVNIGTGMSYQWGDSHERIEQSDGVIEFFTGNNEKMRLQGSTLLVGSTTAIDTTLSGGTPALQVVGSGFGAIQSITRRDSGAYGPSLILAKSKNATVGSYTAVVDNDSLGSIIFIGDDGTDLDTYGAMIGAEVNGTPGSNDMPTDLVFSINSGSASATERMRLTFNQYDASELEVTAASSSNNNANAWVRTRSKNYYWNGISLESHNSSSGNIDGIGSIMGKYQSGSPEIKFFIGGTGPATGTDAIIIDGSANVNVITGNLKISTSGKGIDFSATGQASGMTNELLDDYEEGTWTPVFMDQSNSSNPTITYDIQNGSYTKIGDTCFAHFNLGTDSVSGGASNVYLAIGGLPFTSASNSPRGGLSISGKYAWPGTQPTQGSLFQSSTINNLWTNNNAGSNVPTDQLGTGSDSNRLNGTIMYKTA